MSLMFFLGESLRREKKKGICSSFGSNEKGCCLGFARGVLGLSGLFGSGLHGGSILIYFTPDLLSNEQSREAKSLQGDVRRDKVKALFPTRAASATTWEFQLEILSWNSHVE